MIGVIATIAVFASILMLVLQLTSTSQSKKILAERLQGVDEAMAAPAVTQEPEDELEKSFSDRVVTPLYNAIGERVMNSSKAAQIENLQKLLAQADVTDKTPQQLLGQQYILPVIFVVGVILLGLFMKFSLIEILGGGAFLAFLGYKLPTASIESKGKKRAKEISKALPGVMDLLTISMEAGLSLDMAMVRVSDSEPGPLGREFAKTLDEIRLGRPRIDALSAMAERNVVEELDSFIRAVVQAEPLGVSIANVLRVQSEDLRRIRKQRAEEKGHRAPVLMLLPMMLCIFPCVFLVLLGPAAVKIFGH